MTAKEYLKQAYLLDKQIQVEVKELEQLRAAACCDCESNC